MDKENGKSSEGSSGSSKLSNQADPANLLDAASLFGVSAYWPRGDANTANLFAAAAAGGAYGLGPHSSMPFSMLPPQSGRGVSPYPPASSAAAYNNAYTNTLSVAASQAASLGIPAASAAWWSMASHLAAQDYLVRLQASGINFPGLGNPNDPYAALGLSSLSASGHHKPSKSSKSSSSMSKSTSHHNAKDKLSASSLSIQSGNKLDGRLDPMTRTSSSTSNSKSKYSTTHTSSGLTIQPSIKMSNSSGSCSTSSSSDKNKIKNHESNYLKSMEMKAKCSSPKNSQPPCSSIFTSPLSLTSNSDGRADGDNTMLTSTVQSLSSTGLSSGLPSSILSDPNSILGGVRLPPDTEIIKYTSSIVGPKIPGTTNRGRKKTISLDPPLVSVHPTHSSTGMLIERSTKRQRLDSSGSDQNSTTSNSGNDRVEVIKLPATNGSPSGISFGGGFSESGGEAPLNLSLKPTTSNHHNNTSSSLSSLSNMSANIGYDRISRRKPGPKPRKVLQSPTALPPGAPSASLVQLFATADSPRPPSRSDMDIPFTSSCTTTGNTTITSLPAPNHKDTRPRNLGRGVSKPKKNTVASLLAQSRALGIKPMPILDPNASMSQQMSLLKSNILAAQQYIAEVGGDEKTLNKFLQEKFRGTLSDSSTVDASTDSDNLTDSNQTDSEMETDFSSKKQKHYDEQALRIPVDRGWKRETIIRGITKNGGIKGDVTYVAPDSSNKFKQMSDITQYLEYQKNTELTKENFTFSCRVILGEYLQVMPPEFASEGEFVRMSEEDVSKRLEELRAAMRTNLPVEQRIEVARRQQAARAAARLDREQARIAREIERSERQEAARRDREARSQQIMEGRKRLAFTLEQKIQIISEIEGGKSKSDVSRELGLASSTVATIWKNRSNIINAYGSDHNQGSSSPSTTSLIDSDTFKSDVCSDSPAKRKRQEDIEKQKQEEQLRKQQERELKRQQTAIIKEQMYIQEISKQRELLYTVELERERRRQHMTLVKQIENRRKLEERERKKQQLLVQKQAEKEKKMEQRRMEMEILTELRKPCEDLELDQRALPEYNRIHGLKLSGKAFGDVVMVFEFLHNFGETLGFDMESLPTLDSLQLSLLSNEGSSEAEEELLSVMTHLIVCAIEDPGIPNPARHTTILGQSLRQADITHANLSEILRIYLYANATGEVKALTGVSFERDREKRVADHHQNCGEMLSTQTGKNSIYYDQLHGNATWKMSDMLKDRPFMALAPSDKAAILAFICNELLQNKAVIRQIEGSLETVAHSRKEKWVIDAKVRKLRMMHNRKVRSEALEKAAHAKLDEETGDLSVVVVGVDSPALHKDDLLDEEENEIMSENESVGTQPEEEEDNKLSAEELGKKLEKVLKTSETQLHVINTASHQLRATCFGQDRYWSRYWSLPKAGGIFVEAMESAEPELLEEQIKADNETDLGIKSVDDIKRIIHDIGSINDPNVDHEVSSIVAICEQNVCNKDEDEQEVKITDNNANEHRKTPNRLNFVENGEIIDKREHNLDELRKSVDRIVQSLELNIELEKENAKNSIEESQENHIKQEPVETDIKKFNLFEKLGECMERENTRDEEIKPEVKEELKNEILNELKSEIKTEIKTEIKSEIEEEKSDSETKWFSVLNKEGVTCEGVHLTAGNRWDTGTGACTRDNLTELKIPVFPPPNSNQSYVANSCDSPAPLQVTPEESAQLEYIKQHGLPKPCERKGVPNERRYGWWRILNTDDLKNILENLHVRGARERELKRSILNLMQVMYEQQGKLFIEEGQKDATELSIDEFDVPIMEGGAPFPDPPGSWNPIVGQRVDTALLEQVEALEDKVANASMQQKGWKVPSREGPRVTIGEVVFTAKDRLSSLEAAIERRYLKPPLGVNTGDPNLAAMAQEAAGTPTPAPPVPGPDDIPKGLAVWRDAIARSQTSAQLAMCLYTLEASIAWDKSIMKANCQFCNSGDNEDKLLLCDSCDKGYHTYCFKPKLDTIPEGDWYCHECMNKATGEKNCIVCGKKQSLTNTRLVSCELCPRAYHTDCIRPSMSKVPRGKWYCSNCISKKPVKKPVKKNCSKPTRDSESSEHPPLSPAPSHSSATTNEDIALQQQPVVNSCVQSDVSNSSIPNTGSPATQAARNKEKATKKISKELVPCKAILDDLECHDDAWPFLLPVNTKQFPTYKKIIKSPMDLSTIKKRIVDLIYRSKEEFCADVRQIFNNCETFNEDDSPVGKAGHCMRQFFEARWNELCIAHS